MPDFACGVCFVPLSAISEPAFVLPAIVQALAVAQMRLGDHVFAAAWTQGRSMTSQQALAAQEQTMLSTPTPTRPAASPMKSPTFPAGLTAREVEVLRGLSQGWTDAQIAKHLVISPRTVNRYTTSLYSKLGVSSRAATTRCHFPMYRGSDPYAPLPIPLSR